MIRSDRVIRPFFKKEEKIIGLQAKVNEKKKGKMKRGRIVTLIHTMKRTIQTFVSLARAWRQGMSLITLK